MIAKRIYARNESACNFRRLYGYLATELDRLDRLTNMVVDVPGGKPASYKRNNSPSYKSMYSVQSAKVIAHIP